MVGCVEKMGYAHRPLFRESSQLAFSAKGGAQFETLAEATIRSVASLFAGLGFSGGGVPGVVLGALMFLA